VTQSIRLTKAEAEKLAQLVAGTAYAEAALLRQSVLSGMQHFRLTPIFEFDSDSDEHAALCQVAPLCTVSTMRQSFACQSMKPSKPKWRVQVAFGLPSQGMAGSDLLEHMVILQGGMGLANSAVGVAHHTGKTDKFINVKSLPSRI